MSLYAADGSFNVSIVSGSSYTGLMAADGSYNVVKAPGGSYVGAYAPCGAYYVTVTDSAKRGFRAPDGSLYVSSSPYVPNGAARITIVAGSFTPGGFVPTFHILGF